MWVILLSVLRYAIAMGQIIIPGGSCVGAAMLGSSDELVV